MAQRQTHQAQHPQQPHSIITNIFLSIFLIFLVFVAGATVVSIFQENEEIGEPAQPSEEELLNPELTPEFEFEADPDANQ
jgi:Na+/proline symporter